MPRARQRPDGAKSAPERSTSGPRRPAARTDPETASPPNGPGTFTTADDTVVRDDQVQTNASPPLFGVVIFAALVVAAAGLKITASIVAPVFLVLTLVITVHPLRAWLVRHKAPQAVGSIVAMLAMFAALVLVLGSVVWSLTKLVTILPDYTAKFTDLYNQGLSLLGRFGVSTSSISDAVSGLSLTSFTGVAQTLLNTITSGASLLALMIAMIFFLAVDAAGMGQRLELIRAKRPAIADAFVDFAGSVRKYWVVTTVFGAIVAVLDWFALLIIGVPLALTWAVLAFVTNYIPNVGFIIGLLPPVLIALLDGGVGPAIATLVVYLAINIIIQTLIQPRFTGDAVGITGTVAFLSLIVWAFLLGALGALLAVPATLMVKALLVDHSASGRWFGALIDATPSGADASEPGIGRAGEPSEAAT